MTPSGVCCCLVCHFPVSGLPTGLQTPRIYKTDLQQNLEKEGSFACLRRKGPGLCPHDDYACLGRHVWTKTPRFAHSHIIHICLPCLMNFPCWMGLLWLATFAGAKDRRCRLASRRVLQGHGGVRLDSIGLQRDGEAGSKARVRLGLLHVSPGPHYQGALTPWPDTAWSAFHDLQQPADAFLLNIDAVFSLDVPLIVHDLLDKAGNVSTNSRLRQPVFWPSFGTDPERWRRAAGQINMACRAVAGHVAGQWGQDSDNSSPMAIALVWKVAEAILRGNASSCLCLVRWFSMAPNIVNAALGCPPLAWARQVSGQHVDADNFEFLTADVLSDFLQQVRGMWQTTQFNMQDEVECAKPKETN